MFYWDEERVRFMEDAAAWGDFHARLAAELAKSLPPESRICDAGCGTGHLSLALSPYVRQVTAVDVSQQALSLLADNCRKRNVTNIAIRCGDIHSLPPEEPYDAMVFCFFGRMEEIAAIAKAQCRGTVFAFKKNYTTHRFSVGSHATGSYSFSAAKAWLSARGVPFTAQEMALELGQPFRSWESARRFFEIYSRDEDKSVITDAFLRSKLVETGREDFPLYLPHQRPVGCLKFSVEDLPKT